MATQPTDSRVTRFARHLRAGYDEIGQETAMHELVACTLLSFELTGRCVIGLAWLTERSVALSHLDAAVRDRAASGAKTVAGVVAKTVGGLLPWFERIEGHASVNEARRLTREALEDVDWVPQRVQAPH